MRGWNEETEKNLIFIKLLIKYILYNIYNIYKIYIYKIIKFIKLEWKLFNL